MSSSSGSDYSQPLASRRRCSSQQEASAFCTERAGSAPGRQPHGESPQTSRGGLGRCGWALGWVWVLGGGLGCVRWCSWGRAGGWGRAGSAGRQGEEPLGRLEDGKPWEARGLGREATPWAARRERAVARYRTPGKRKSKRWSGEACVVNKIEEGASARVKRWGWIRGPALPNSAPGGPRLPWCCAIWPGGSRSPGSRAWPAPAAHDSMHAERRLRLE